MEKEGALYNVGDCKLLPLWKSVWRFLKNLKIEPPYDPAVTAGHTPKGLQFCLGDTCTTVLLTALVTDRGNGTSQMSVLDTFLLPC